MHRFFIALEALADGLVHIMGGPASQIVRVLRLKPGDRVIVLDGSGMEYETEISTVGMGRVEGRVVRTWEGEGEPRLKVTICQALIKADKFEWVLQKGVELGAIAFQPFVSERCVAARPAPARLERWRAIIREAAEQSGRAVLPLLLETVHLSFLCQPARTPALMLWEKESATGLRQALRDPAFASAPELRLIVGPEGGFTEAEVDLARGSGIAVAGLGGRILRAETAAPVALSAIMYERGELGG